MHAEFAHVYFTWGWTGHPRDGQKKRVDQTFAYGSQSANLKNERQSKLYKDPSIDFIVSIPHCPAIDAQNPRSPSYATQPLHAYTPNDFPHLWHSWTISDTAKIHKVWKNAERSQMLNRK